MNLTEETGIEPGSRIALRYPNVEGNPVLAIMEVQAIEEVGDEQMQTMTDKVYRTTDPEHPASGGENGLIADLLAHVDEFTICWLVAKVAIPVRRAGAQPNLLKKRWLARAHYMSSGEIDS